MAYTPNQDYEANYINNLLKYLKTKRDEDYGSKALALYSLSSTGGATYYNDDYTSDTVPTGTAKVNLKYNNVAVDAKETPDGWTKTNTGEYTYPISYGNNSPASTFKYVVASGTYQGIEVQRNAVVQGISINRVAYYGFYSSNNVNDINAAVATLNRITSNYSANSVNNGTGANAYLWLVTKTSATGEEMTVNAMADPVTKSFTSPRVSTITIGDYKVYISKGAYPPGSNGIVVNIKI